MSTDPGYTEWVEAKHCRAKRPYSVREASVRVIGCRRKWPEWEWRAYECMFCGSWHVGRVDKGKTSL